jgi:hypothetical protein
MLGAAALVLGVGGSAKATVSPVKSSPFDFSVEKPKDQGKGLLKRVLDRVDGGNFHGFGLADGTTKKAEDPLKTCTIRLKFHF